MNVMRSIWFKFNGEPIEEKSSDSIEQKNLDIFQDQLNNPKENIPNERNLNIFKLILKYF